MFTCSSKTQAIYTKGFHEMHLEMCISFFVRIRLGTLPTYTCALHECLPLSEEVAVFSYWKLCICLLLPILISFFLNLLMLVLWPIMWFFWRVFHVQLQRMQYSVGFGWGVLYISVISIWSIVSFKAIVSLVIFYLGYLYISISGVSSTIITINFSLYVC